MKNNIHSIERGIRILLGLCLIGAYFMVSPNLWLLLGIFPLLTGLVGWCPPYQLLGINTCNLGKN